MKKKEQSIPLPANGWRTAKWMKEAYGVSNSLFYRWKMEMLTSGYEKGVWQVNKQVTFINEKVWQKFLQDKSNKNLKEEYGI